MRNPLTADERERRFVEYARTLNKGQLAEFKLTRLNRIANFRRQLMELVEEMIELRAEDIAAGMLMEKAEPRPQIRAVKELPRLRNRKMPPWIAESRGLSRRKA